MLKKYLAAFVLICLLLSGCKKASGLEKLNIAGSTTIFPFINAAAEEFQAEAPGVEVDVQGGGSSVGVEQVAEGIIDIGMASRNLKSEEETLGLRIFPIAVDAIALIVNPANPVRDLTADQVRGIFSGKTTDWKEVGGRPGEIIVVNRDEASGTREAFKKIVMLETPFMREAVIQPGSGQVRSIVASAPGAIGYISLGHVTREVRAIAYDGVKPVRKSVMDGKYGIQRTLNLLTKGEPSGLKKKFIDYVLSPRIQEEIIGVEFIPVSGRGGK